MKMYEKEARFYNLEMDVKDNKITRINAEKLHVILLEPKPLRWDGDKPVYREPYHHEPIDFEEEDESFYNRGGPFKHGDKIIIIATMDNIEEIREHPGCGWIPTMEPLLGQTGTVEISWPDCSYVTVEFDGKTNPCNWPNKFLKPVEAM